MTLETGASLPIDIHCAKKSILHQKMKDKFALHISNKVERQTVRTQTRLLLQEQSDLGTLCLTKRVQKHLDRRRKQTRFIVIGAFKVE